MPTLHNFLLGIILHTALFYPGSSGGPLIDKYGNVIGINAIYPYVSNIEIIGLSAAVISDDLIDICIKQGIPIKIEKITDYSWWINFLFSFFFICLFVLQVIIVIKIMQVNKNNTPH